MRALVAGWFTFEYMGATAGDLLAAEVVGSWLQDAGCPYDVAVTETLGAGVDWQTVDPGTYSHVVFVCGPLGNGEPATTLFERFGHAQLLGVDLSMLHRLQEWNPFDLLLERDSDRTARPDISLLAVAAPVPVIGMVLVHEQKEYAQGRHRDVQAAIEQAVEALDVAVVRIDTCLDPPNEFELRTASQIESVIARMDVVVTTRLHGLVLALKNGVPAVAVDPVDGGAKVHRQAQVLGWPHALTPDEATPDAIQSHVTACLQDAARALARRCSEEAQAALTETRDEFVRFFNDQQGGRVMARIVLGSYMVRYPLGGMLSWALQYIIGLHRLGHDVVFVEKAPYPQACYDPVDDTMTDDGARGMGIVAGLLDRFGMPGRWCFVDYGGTYHGMRRETIEATFREADLFVDMGTHGAWAEEADAAGRRVLIDGEPGFTQMKRATRLATGDAVLEYDAYFTSGINVGTGRSTAPAAGVQWHPLPHPVVLDLFTPTPAPDDGPITTVMNWQSYDRLTYEGQTYGHKDLSFEAFAELPARIDAPVELAVGGPDVPVDRLRSLGWRIRDGHQVTATLDDFWAYIRASRAEFSLCKQGYVATRSGWFSDRGGAYLASGRPVIQQDTGFGDLLPVGEGLFAVATVEEAATAIEAVLTDPVRHASAAREIAEEHLDSRRLLPRWLKSALP